MKFLNLSNTEYTERYYNLLSEVQGYGWELIRKAQEADPLFTDYHCGLFGITIVYGGEEYYLHDGVFYTEDNKAGDFDSVHQMLLHLRNICHDLNIRAGDEMFEDLNELWGGDFPSKTQENN